MVKRKLYLRLVSMLCVTGLILALTPSTLIAIGVKANADGDATVGGEPVEVSFDSMGDVNGNFDCYYFTDPIKQRGGGQDTATGVKIEDYWDLVEEAEGNYIVRKNITADDPSRPQAAPRIRP